MALTSVSGLVALLDDKSVDMKAFALKRLNELVDEFWAEISESVNKIEILYEDDAFEYNKLAAILASKVYYHLSEYEEALRFALCAEELFDINHPSEFVETIISKCIDKYTELRVAQDHSSEPAVLIRHDSMGDGAWLPNSSTYKRLEHVVDRMFDRCFDQKQYKQALGIAIEARRFDMFEKALTLADDNEGMLRYAFRVVTTLIDSVRLRNRLLRILVSVFMTRPTPADSINVCQCLVLIDDPQSTADILERLLLQSEESAVTAYQIAFDLYENSTQVFLQRVSSNLSRSPKLNRLMSLIEKVKRGNNEPKPALTDASSGSQPAAETKKEADTEATPTKMESSDAQPETSTGPATEESEKPAAQDPAPAAESLSDSDKEIKKRLENLCSILSGDKVIELHLQFLIRNNRADLRLLEKIREEGRHSVTHNATVLANGIMHCGTTSDQFLREHLNWLGRAVNWAKFTATATLGVIHRGHEKEALRLMSAYLPKDASGSSGSVYTEGGGLFALGLIHANHGGSMIDYLLNQCKEATAEPVRHGACLGLGLAAMGTAREDVYEQIKSNLYQDDAVTGEAAGIGMGLVMLGTGSPLAIEDMLGYAKETAHEKIIRGIALGIAMVMYGQSEEADELIDRLVVDNDPILRWAGMATIGMAYCGTGNNRSVKRLLHAAVSDTNDDVRRWAVTSLGFIMFKNPDQVPALVSLLTESYHPHLRHGAAMAMGIGCAGTALKEAVGLLETLYEGTVPFVRQGALVATAMVLMQQNGVTCPKSVEFREKCLKIIGDRHEDLLAKFGAILACGIMDAGGCNMTISLQTRTGNNNMVAAVGLLIFQNFWFWYPLTNFLSLALTPTTLIALNKDLKMPKMQFRSNAKASMFAYPQPLQPEKEKKREKVETAILSITAKQRKKEADRKHYKEQQQQQKVKESTKEERMEVEPSTSAAPEATKEIEKPVTEEKREDKEPPFAILNNPARVLRAQQRVISLPENCRYHTLKPITQAGILMVLDHRPQETEVFVEMVHGHGPTGDRTITSSSASGTAGGADVSVAGAQATSQPEPIHASTIGAYLDDYDDEYGEEEDDEEEEELDDESLSGMQEDEEDEEFEITVIPGGQPEKMDVDEGETTAAGVEGTASSGTKREIRSKTSAARSAKSSSASNVEPGPPEPFQYIEEGADTGGATTSSAGPSASKPSTSEDTNIKKKDEKKPDSKDKKDEGSSR